MKLYIGKEAGFCWGVKRAVNLTEKALDNPGYKNVYTYGPLIHNPQVVEQLEKKGIKITTDPSNIKEGAVVIRAHGIPPQKLQKIQDIRGVTIVDGTCPHVSKSEKKVAEYATMGYHIIIVGDPAHAEVVSLVGFADTGKSPNKNYSIISAVEELQNLKISCEKIFLIAQSTYKAEIFYRVIDYFKNAGKYKVEYHDSICSEPLRTQDELKEMCKFVECVIIVGGRNSANTRRLEEIVLQLNKHLIQIETEQELKPEELSKFYSIALTAGASTPDWIIEKIINKIKNYFNKIEIEVFDGRNSKQTAEQIK
ncbi:MAG: 4-hydroxy-3-methylbut-2-enyl diphosphate reductase [Planctomycetota bacterium]